MEQSVQAVVEWLHNHQDIILIVIAGVSFLESLAIVGIVVPGITLLFAAGTAAGSTGIDLTWVLFSAAAGAIAGDGLSFLLGYHYHSWIRTIRPFSTHPQWIERGEQFFRRYGLMGIVIGRFVGPIRPVMPLVAGFMQMKPWKFFSINAASAVAWAPFYLMPGYIVGASMEHQDALSGKHALFLIGTLFFGWLLAQFTWWTYLHIHQRRNKIQLALAVAASCAALFMALSHLMQLESIILINQKVALWGVSLRHPWLDSFFVGLTQMGYRAPMTLWAALVTLALVWQRNWYATGIWMGGLLVAQWLLFGLKNFYGWQRPLLVSQPPESFAYPSGHTSMSLVFVGLLAILCLPGVPAKRQKAVLSFAFMLAATIAASRLYLTVHWFTDILGGLLLGAFMLAAIYGLLLKKPFKLIKPIPLVAASLLAWTISLGIWVLPYMADLLTRYSLR